MLKLLVFCTLMLFWSRADKQTERYTVTFDIKDIMNMSGNSELVNGDGQVLGKIELRKDGVSVDDLIVAKIDGVYQILGSTNAGITLNTSMTKIKDSRDGELVWKREMLSQNGISWSSEGKTGVELKTVIGKGEVTIKLEENLDPGLRAMLLLERIHYIRAILISGYSFS
ncbi:hypothetical protein LZF95_07020 [Algoriphagus sp. AGSA1]|uniref:hypothetical protein n=1 Tax=Algoriphagus sp. AGSA1 TaxID=2907213 RepID=UPI001F205C6D|nr:hypothetical protein [Algoriphagus sp. AGSA1]MCE7054417.1 hypothetical protein [Algoriphagus sp. AGSA1]